MNGGQMLDLQGRNAPAVRLGGFRDMLNAPENDAWDALRVDAPTDPGRTA
jgi:hypothetical protein